MSPVIIVVIFGVLVCVCFVKVPSALRNFEADFVKNFRKDSNVRIVYDYVARNLGPVGSIEVIVRRKDDGPILGEAADMAIGNARRYLGRGDLTEAEQARTERDLRAQLSLGSADARAGARLMQTIDEFQTLVETELNPPIRKTLSLVDLVKFASVGRLIGWSVLELPRFEWQFAMTMVLIDQKLGQEYPELMRNFLTGDRKALRINLRALESDDVYNN
jgi:hypothetical protein